MLFNIHVQCLNNLAYFVFKPLLRTLVMLIAMVYILIFLKTDSQFLAFTTACHMFCSVTALQAPMAI